MAQKIGYQEAMQNLKTMFSEIDQDVIHSILVTHQGKIDPTIQDLLKLCDHSAEEEEENVFEEAKVTKPRENKEAVDDLEIAKSEQEKEDMKYAMRLQEQYQKNTQVRSHGSNRKPRYVMQSPYMQPGIIQPVIIQQQRPYQYDQYQQHLEAVHYRKPKKTFSQKMKDAKAKFLKMFKKGKKNKNALVAENNIGGYSELDHIEDIDVISPNSRNKVEIYQDLDEIPNLQLNPYTNQKDNIQPMKKKSEERLHKDYNFDTDADEQIPQEEAKIDFKLMQQEDFHKPTADIADKRETTYPKFESRYYKPQHTESNEIKRTNKKYESLI